METTIAATVEYRPKDSEASDSTTGLGLPGDLPRVEMVLGSRQTISRETDELLRSRLRSATGYLAAGSLLFTIRSLLLSSQTLHWSEPAVFLFLVGIVVALSPRWAPEPKRLRLLVPVVFGVSTVSVLLWQYDAVLTQSSLRNEKTLLLSIKNGNVSIFGLMMVYGMFIPNTWRRAAAFVIPIALSPVVVPLSLVYFHPGFAEHAREISSPDLVSSNFLTLFLGAALAIFGTYTINALRIEAFEARQLGQYRLGRRLGRGGMGEVYLAEHQLLKRPCAIKLIHSDQANDPRALARFEREVRSTARLSHPNTIEIYDYGRTDDGTFYYAMEYLRGLSLDELVAKHGPLPPNRVIYLLRQACGALSEAHGAGLIHRDIKPANIFASRRGNLHDFVKILDFGLVKKQSGLDPDSIQLSQAGAISGSPLYMSPEQASGEHDPDGRADLYALGGVAYYLLTGQPPFAGRTPFQVMIAHARDPVAPPSNLQVGIPADLEAVVLRCLAKAADDRFPDAESLDQALAACADAEGWDAQQARDWWLAHEPIKAAEDLEPDGQAETRILSAASAIST